MLVEVRDVPSHPTACVHLLRRPSELPASFDKYLPHVRRVVAHGQGRFDGPPFLLYRGMVDGKLEVELGIPLEGSVAALRPAVTLPEGTVGESELPAGRAAVWVYTGPYEGLGDAWGDFNSWLLDNGFNAANTCWESYIDNPDVVPVDELRTELYQLLD
jgi:effector-binding domain-containing protein